MLLASFNSHFTILVKLLPSYILIKRQSRHGPASANVKHEFPYVNGTSLTIYMRKKTHFQQEIYFYKC